MFNASVTLVSRFASRGVLNSASGVALAPASVDEFGGDLLVGNFDDRAISTVDPHTRAFIEHLTDSNGEAIVTAGPVQFPAVCGVGE